MKKNRGIREMGRGLQGRVRTQWAALAAALVVVAGLTVAWALSNAGDRVQVVQLVRPVASGQAFTADDLGTTGVAHDGAVQGLVPAQSLEALVGRVAAVDLEAGLLVQKGMWRDTPLLSAGESSVGVVLAPGRFPAGLGQGDAVLAAAAAPGSATSPVRARVVAAEVTPEGDTSFTLAVADADAVVVAQLSATDQLVLVGDNGGGGA